MLFDNLGSWKNYDLEGARTKLEKLDACKDKLTLFALCQIGILEEL